MDTHSAEQPVDPDATTIQPDESPEVTLDRTRRLLARSRITLDAADRRLSPYDGEETPAPHRPADS
jgi:hypothetical protein